MPMHSLHLVVIFPEMLAVRLSGGLFSATTGPFCNADASGRGPPVTPCHIAPRPWRGCPGGDRHRPGLRSLSRSFQQRLPCLVRKRGSSLLFLQDLVVLCRS